MEEAKLAPKNFIEEFIQQDIQEKGLSRPASRRSLTAICTLATLRRCT